MLNGVWLGKLDIHGTGHQKGQQDEISGAEVLKACPQTELFLQGIFSSSLRHSK